MSQLIVRLYYLELKVKFLFKMCRLELLTAMLLVSGGSALYSESPDVVTLTADSFAQLVTNSSDVWLVMFYAPWCGASRRSVSEYSKAACALKGITKGAKLGAMDAEKYYDATFPYVYDTSTGYLFYPRIEVFTGSQHVPYESSRSAENYITEILDAAKKQVKHRLSREECKLLGDSTISSEEIENTETTTEELLTPSTETTEELLPSSTETAEELLTSSTEPAETTASSLQQELTTEIDADSNTKENIEATSEANVEITTDDLVQSAQNGAETTTQNLKERFPHLAEQIKFYLAEIRRRGY